MAVGADGYLEMLQALLPRGLAWPRDPDATLTHLLHAIADGLAAVDQAGADLIGEIHLGTTVDLLPDWERVLGLPDTCSGALSGTVSGRRAVAVQAIRRHTDASPPSYTAIAAEMGYEGATVIERVQADAERIVGLDTSGGRWAYVWWLRVPAAHRVRYKDVLSPVTAPLAEQISDAELECRIRRVAPAHTYPVVIYV